METKNKLFKFIETSNDAVIIFNKDFDVIFANNALLKSLAVTRDEYIERGILSFTHPEDKKRLDAIIQQIFKTPNTHYKEKIRNISKVGVINHYEWSAYYDESEKVVFAQGRLLESHGNSDSQIYGEAKKLAQIGVWEYHVELNYVKWMMKFIKFMNSPLQLR